MLTKIELYNFLSFKGKTEIDFTKTNYKYFEDTHTKNGITKGAVFVGGNAMGKSNILKSLKVLSDMLYSEDFFKYAHRYKSLLTDETYFYIKCSFLINDNTIEYYIKYDVETKIIKETLDINNTTVLSRLGDNAELFLEEGKEELFDKSTVVKDILFLRTHYYNTKFNNNTLIQEFMVKLNNLLFIDQHIGVISGLYLKDLDINEDLNDEKVLILNKFLEEINYNFRVEIKKSELSSEVVTYMRRIDTKFALPIALESRGNQVILQTVLPFIHAINNDSILIIDEFSSGFHNELEEKLIRFFLENTKEGQIFITTHSTNILSNKLLRPDQMFSVDYSVESGSTIKRFSVEQPRLSQNTEKMYESGVFGGLPRYDRN